MDNIVEFVDDLRNLGYSDDEILESLVLTSEMNLDTEEGL